MSDLGSTTMRTVRCGAGMVVVLVCSTAFAQPLPLPVMPSERTGTTQIPMTMPRGTEVMGAAAAVQITLAAAGVALSAIVLGHAVAHGN